MPAASPAGRPHPGAWPDGRVGRRQWGGRAFAIGLAVVACGLLTWAVLAYYAGRRRSRWLGLAAAGHFALLATVFATLGTGDPERIDALWDTVGMLALVGTWPGGVVHVAVVSAE